MEIEYQKTIAAISTAMSNSGIGIVRMSGPEAFEIADQIYRGKNNKNPIQFTTGISWKMGRRLMKCW